MHRAVATWLTTERLKLYYLMLTYFILIATYGNVLNKTITEDERLIKQNQIIPLGPAKTTVDQPTTC